MGSAAVQQWSLTSLREKLVKIGAKVVLWPLARWPLGSRSWSGGEANAAGGVASPHVRFAGRNFVFFGAKQR
jgi:hypothetical protein